MSDEPDSQASVTPNAASEDAGLAGPSASDAAIGPTTTKPTLQGDSGQPYVSPGSPDSAVAMPTQPAPPPAKINDCSGLAADGVFEEITPPEVKAVMSMRTDGGGTFAIAVDQVNQGTLYAGTLSEKLWKSTDCGATWKHITTGRNGDRIDSGMNWTLALDPTDPQVVYTNSGYGSNGNGLFKSTNGGVDWDVVWPPASQPELAKAFTYNFANVIDIDPSNHLHILLTFHENCLAPHPATCIAETTNGGSTWRLIDGDPSWQGNEGQVIFFLGNSSTWLWGSQSNGFYRSGDSGAHWQAIPGMTTSHLQSSQLLRVPNGGYFMAAADGIWRSTDGTVPTWALVPDTGPIVGGLVSSGTTMFASTCYFPDYCAMPRYLRAPLGAGQTWTTMSSPKVNLGGTMGYDKGHSLLYSSNLKGGLWRVVAR